MPFLNRKKNKGCFELYHLKIGTRPGLMVFLNLELKALGKLDE